MLTTGHPLFLLNIIPHLILMATLEERSYDPYVEKTQELSERTQTQLSDTKAYVFYRTSTGLHFNFQPFSSLSFTWSLPPPSWHHVVTSCPPQISWLHIRNTWEALNSQTPCHIPDQLNSCGRSRNQYWNQYFIAQPRLRTAHKPFL